MDHVSECFINRTEVIKEVLASWLSEYPRQIRRGYERDIAKHGYIRVYRRLAARRFMAQLKGDFNG
jgi:hypothetical protein